MQKCSWKRKAFLKMMSVPPKFTFKFSSARQQGLAGSHLPVFKNCIRLHWSVSCSVWFMEQLQFGNKRFFWDGWLLVWKGSESRLPAIKSLFPTRNKEMEKKRGKKDSSEHMRKIFGSLCSPLVDMHEMVIIKNKYNKTHNQHFLCI